MTTTIQFHLVNNTEMRLDAVWLRVDDAYYLAQKLAAHGDAAHGDIAHFAMELPDKGDDHMTISIQDYNWGLFGTDVQKKIFIDKQALTSPVIISIEDKPADTPWVTWQDQNGNHYEKFSTVRRGAIAGVTIPNGQ
ncbi:MAG: hypothetical protein DYG89_47225 [Caldilinea sp. CFX5]|nr:hypothetical protein [Caldilinea sp. CFX5]